MNPFTPAEIDYLNSVTLGRLATVGKDGQPHLVPLTFKYNDDEGTIDIGGIGFNESKKWRDVQNDRHVTFLLDDFDGRNAHGIEVRAEAEVHESGGSKINPRFPQFVEQFIRLRPRYIASWGIEPDTGMMGGGFKAYGRRV